jgi:hypothetical protein
MKWVLVALFMLDGVPQDSGMLGAKTEDDCNKAKAVSIAFGHSQGFDVWAECREVKLEPRKEKPKPKGEPGTEQKS